MENEFDDYSDIIPLSLRSKKLNEDAQFDSPLELVKKVVED